jgi:hypothetical protein
VRTLAIGLASLALHGLVMAVVPLERERLWFVLLEPEAPEPVDVVAIELFEMPAEPVPLPVPLPLPDPVAEPAAAPDADAPVARVTRGARTTGIAETGTGTGTATGTGTEPEGELSGALAMRDAARNRPFVLAIPAGPPMPELEPEAETPDGVRANRDGTYTKVDRTFVATINPDGSVDLADRPNVRVKLLPGIPKPGKIGKALADHLEDWSEDPYGVSTGQGNRNKREGIVDDDGDDKDDEGGTVPILGGSFDITDAVMRWAGQDPYEARKRKFLEETFDERVEIGRVHRANELARSDKKMQRNLDALRARDDLSAEDKRALVFELWDECAETGSEQLVAGGAKARAALYRWVRVHFAEGSDDGYTADELERLNARRKSSATFAPYR